MKLRHLLFLLLCPAAVFAESETRPTTVELVSTAGNPIQFDFATKESLVSGGARLTYGESILTADEIRYSQVTGIANAHGHVVITRRTLRLLADEAIFTRADGKFRLKHVRLGAFPLYAESPAVEGDFQSFTLHDATITYGEPGWFVPTVKAKSFQIVSGKNYDAEHARLSLGSFPLLRLPHLSQRLDQPPIETTVLAGYRPAIGPYVDLTTLFPTGPGVGLGAELGLFGSRGVMIGPAAHYERKTASGEVAGELSSGWIHDFGHRDPDILGQPIGAERGFVDWQHLQTFGDHLTVTGQLKYWSDSDVIRDFHRNSFTPDQQPDSFFEADYATNNTLASAFVRVQPNNFYPIQQRLPELSFNLLPSNLGGGFVQRGDVGYVRLQDDAVGSSSPDLSSQRFDAFYALERPWAATPWLTLTPVAGGRLTHYFTALGGRSNYTRALGEIGGDLRLRAYGNFDVKDENGEIDGLRHLIEPFLQYRYIPNAEKGRAYIPQIDTTVFSTRLQPLDLGDIRFLDDLHEINTLRWGLEQRLQTRAAHGGSRDLAALTLAQDLRFHPAAGETRRSDFNIDLMVAPASWLQFDVFQRIDEHTFGLHEFNSGITLTNTDVWSLRFGTQYLRGSLEEYDTAVSYKLNERFALTGRWRYDARQRLLYEQTYGLRQVIRNLWSVEYQLAWTKGEQRESGFHFRIVLDVFKF